jgi:hypothetical protein
MFSRRSRGSNELWAKTNLFAEGLKNSLYVFRIMEWKNPELGVLDEPYSAKPAQVSSHTGPGYT